MKSTLLFYLFFWGYIIIQMYIPLHYYLFQSDKFDERFTWRMFSDIDAGYRELTFKGISPHYKDPIILPKDELFTTHWNAVLLRGNVKTIKKARIFLCKNMSYLSKIRSIFIYYPWNGNKEIMEEETECKFME
jgi:hypothetical protein